MCHLGRQADGASIRACVLTVIRGHLDTHSILTPVKHGFQSGHSCEFQLLLTTHDLMKQSNLRHQVDIGSYIVHAVSSSSSVPLR